MPPRLSMIHSIIEKDPHCCFGSLYFQSKFVAMSVGAEVARCRVFPLCEYRSFCSNSLRFVVFSLCFLFKITRGESEQKTKNNLSKTGVIWTKTESEKNQWCLQPSGVLPKLGWAFTPLTYNQNLTGRVRMRLRAGYQNNMSIPKSVNLKICNV